MENNVKIIRRKKGNVLLFKNHEYYKHTVYKNESSLWNCSLKRKNQCKGSVTINKELIVIKSMSHTCPDIISNELTESLDNLKSEAQTSDRPITQLYEEAKESWLDKGNNILTPFPEFNSVKHRLYTARNEYAGVTKMNFKKFHEVQVPLQHRNLVLAEYYYEDTTILVFCMEEDRAKIEQTKEIFGDATFNCSPPPFLQLFTIHAELGSTASTTNTKPIIYALLSDKKTETYTALFNILKSQFPNWEPIKYHCDFELGAINSIYKVFPNIEIKGCYYHWQQAMWRMGKKIFGIKKSKPQARVVALCSVLPLLPSERLLEGWEYIKSRCNTENIKIQNFLNYLQRFWLKNDIVKTLSVFGERHRTNNVSESWHSKLTLKKKFTNIMRLLNALIKLAKNKKNSPIRTRTKIAIENDEFITETLMELISGEISVGYALEMLR
ncbi:hypothetical protein ABMA27_002713 [Loxostege sticticalis]|uniref:MULE transposase domain-containing protein n=1 Tax=Loxostege sticticalis TaxID=481309 RepID=A0ABR3HUN1_LOXSC